MRFRDRRDAGRELADVLAGFDLKAPIIVGIPRGGLMVAHELAKHVGSALDLVVVRKLGYPGHEEAGFGAAAEQDVLVPESLAANLRDASAPLIEVVDRQRAEVEARVDRYVGTRPRPELESRTAIVVDDGIATGYTFVAALEAVRRRGAKRLVAASPVASASGAELVRAHCDELCVLQTHAEGPFAVSLYYEQFEQITEQELPSLLSLE